MLAGFFGHKNVATLVRTALAAGTMGKLALVAVGALREAGGGQEVVAAALGSPLFGVAPFWIRHCSIPFDRPRQFMLRARSRRDKNLISASTRAYLSDFPAPRARSNEDRPEPHRRNISLD